MPFLAWSEHALEGFGELSDSALERYMVKYQSIFIFPLLSFARLSWAASSILWNSAKEPALLFPGNTLLEQVLLAVHYGWYLGGGFMLLGPIKGLIWAVLVQIWCGLFLATVFTLNHVNSSSDRRMECLFILRKRHQQ